MADDETNALLDTHLLAYLHAYQEYTVLNIELQSVLREGHIKLAQARRELSRTTSTSALSFGTTCVPSEFEALLRVGLTPQADGQSSGPPVLQLCESKGSHAKGARKANGGLRNRRQGSAMAADAAQPQFGDDSEDDLATELAGEEGADAEDTQDAEDAVDFRAMLQELGVNRAQVDEIAGALQGGGTQGLMCGDTCASTLPPASLHPLAPAWLSSSPTAPASASPHARRRRSPRPRRPRRRRPCLRT